MTLLIVYLIGAVISYALFYWARDGFAHSRTALVFDIVVSLLWFVVLPTLLIVALIAVLWYFANYFEGHEQ